MKFKVINFHFSCIFLSKTVIIWGKKFQRSFIKILEILFARIYRVLLQSFAIFFANGNWIENETFETIFQFLHFSKDSRIDQQWNFQDLKIEIIFQF